MKGIRRYTHRDREKIISEIVPQIKKKFGENLIALAAQASYARGDDADYSDLELIAFVKEMPEGSKGLEGMSKIRNGLLIELIWTTRETYIAEIKDVAEEWYIAGSDVLLPLSNEEFISELNNYRVHDIKEKCLKRAVRHFPEVQALTTKVLNAIAQQNRQGMPVLVFCLLKEILTSLSFLNQPPYTTLAKYVPEARSFKMKPDRFDELLDLVVEGKYQDLSSLKELTEQVFEGFEKILDDLGLKVYDDNTELNIEKNW